MKEELAVLRVDWVYPSKVTKPKLVALLHRLKKDDWQPSTRKEREPDHRPKPRSAFAILPILITHDTS